MSNSKDKPEQLVTKSETSNKDKLQQLTKSEMAIVLKEVHNPINIINVDYMEVKNDSPQAWFSLNHMTLTNKVIQMGEQLNDKHMNFAQLLLKQQFTSLQGLC